MSENPYQPSATVDAEAGIGVHQGNPWHLRVLGLLCFATFILAAINGFEEELPIRFFALATCASVASQFPGLILALLQRRRATVSQAILLVGAYLVAITGTLAYAVYATNGKPDSLNSAAHMHVIAFPVFHFAMTTFVYLCTGFGAMAAWFFKRS